MTASTQTYGFQYVLPPTRRWYDLPRPSTFPLVEEEARAAFRRRLGVTLSTVRRRLTSYRTQDAIARALDVDRDTVGRWERGEREPKVYDLAELWRRYDVPADWLLEPTDSITELDRRIAGLRHERQTRAAQAAAQAVVEAGTDRPADGDRPARRGRRPA